MHGTHHVNKLDSSQFLCLFLLSTSFLCIVFSLHSDVRAASDVNVPPSVLCTIILCTVTYSLSTIYLGNTEAGKGN